MRRHDQLLLIIDLFRPKSIVEVGTWNGWNAIRMIQHAQKYHDEIAYVGYDLFEDATPETDAVEFNVKKHCTIDGTLAKIKKHCPNADINLIKGNTRDTLKSVTADLAFIDGGHSIDTIRHDYDALRNSSVIVLDDFYTRHEDGKVPNINKVGCNFLAHHGRVLPIKDPLKDGGNNQMVMIT